MPGPEAELRELDELRHKLTEYEAALRSAAPRLAAFKRLEQLARTQGTSPEAIASQAAVEVMKREKDALVTLLAGLANERDQLKGEVAMLLINKTEASETLKGLNLERDDLHIEVAEIVDQLAKIRNDAVRLMSERNALNAEVAALREELQSLNETVGNPPGVDEQPVQAVTLERRADDAVEHADDEQAEPATPVVKIMSAGFVEADVEEDDTDETDQKVEISAETEALAAELEENKVAKKRRELLVPRRTNAETIDTDDETEELESQRFDAFFHAEVDHDKARDWILG